MSDQSGSESDVGVGLALCAVSSVVVGLGVLLGLSFFRPGSGPTLVGSGPLAECCRYDGLHYKDIAVRGYEYDPSRRSDVAFFPLYPLLARGVMSFGVAPEVALLLVSNVLLAATLVVVHKYARAGETDPASPVPVYTVAALAFFPPAVFCHLMYSESTFLCAAALTLLAVRRQAPDWLVAALAGLASAARPVGVALLPVALLYARRRSPGVASFALRAAYLGPLACWGLLAYMAYQEAEFGDAIAFAKTQTYWEVHPAPDPGDKAVSLLTLEPIRGVYSPSSPRYWVRFEHHYEPIYSLIFLNPIIFLAAAATVVAGVWARVTTSYEVVLAAGLLLIPYVTKGYENSMFSTARFAAAVLPCYLVWGRLAAVLPQPVRIGYVALGGYFLGVFAAMFASGYLYF